MASSYSTSTRRVEHINLSKHPPKVPCGTTKGKDRESE